MDDMVGAGAEDGANDAGADSNDQDNVDANIAADKRFKPSSFGLYCRLSRETKEINVAVGVFVVGVFNAPAQTIHPAEIHEN